MKVSKQFDLTKGIDDESFPSLVDRYIEMEGGVRKLAAKIGCSPAYVTDMRLGRRVPSNKILGYFGYRRVVPAPVWVRVC